MHDIPCQHGSLWFAIRYYGLPYHDKKYRLLLTLCAPEQRLQHRSYKLALLQLLLKDGVLEEKAGAFSACFKEI
jgi:hypothetical protein